MLVLFLWISNGVQEVRGQEAYLLDEYPNAQTAFSLNKLSSTYQGDAIRVRRINDNAETNIGFSGSSIDEDTLLAFAGGGDLEVITWYDQSGQARHMTADESSGYTGGYIVQSGEIVRNTFDRPAIAFVPNASMSSWFGIPQTDLSMLGLIDNWPTSAMENTPFTLARRPRDSGGIGFLGSSQVRYHDPTAPNNHSRLILTEGAGRVSGTFPNLLTIRLNGPNLDIYDNNKLIGLTDAATPGGSSAPRVRIKNLTSGTNPHLMEALILYPWVDDTTLEGIRGLLNDGYYFDGEINNTSVFPQERAYQVELYDWLETLSVADVSSPKEPISFTGGGATNDELYGMWLLTIDGNVPPTAILRAPDGNFVLDDGEGRGFETDGENIRVTHTATSGDHRLGLMGAAWWAKLDLPGINNPYFDNDNVKRRLLAQAAVEMMALDQHYTNNSTEFGDYGAMMMMDHAYVFYYLRDVLPINIQETFIEGYRQLVELLNSNHINYPRDVNSNMDSKGIAGAAYIAAAAKEMGRDDIHDYVRDSVRTWLLGSLTATVDESTAPDGVLFHGAGHHTEAGGPEASYIGINIYYYSKAAGAVYGMPGWEWLWDVDGVIDRQVRWMMYQHFPEPDGTYDGPTSFAKRHNGSAVRNQSQSEGRDAWLAMVSDYGKGLLRQPRGGSSFLPPASSTMENTITSYLSNRTFSPEERAMSTWAHGQRWSQRWGVLAYDYYLPGTYDAWSTLETNNDELLNVPYDRTANFSKGFGLAGQPPEWWFYKNNDGAQDFGFMLGATTNAGSGYGSGDGAVGYRGGGALETFWTREGGIFVLGRLPDKFSSNANGVSNILRWSVAHVWGRDGLNTFSIAGRRVTESVSADNNVSPGNLTQRRAFQDDLNGTVLASQVEVASSTTSDGLQMAQTIFGDGTEEADELWAAVPILIRHTRQSVSAETTIDFWDGSAWQVLSEATITPTNAIRLGRDWGSGPSYAYIALDKIRDVQLSALFTSSDQEESLSRTLHLDAHENRGTTLPIPSEETVTYWLTTSDPTEDAPDEDPPGDGEDDPADDPDTTTSEYWLQSGWNLMALNLAPLNDAMEDIFGPVLEDILVVKNTDGDLFSPEFDLNTIGPWRVEEGYWVFAHDDVTLSLEGVPLTADETPITLQPGWQQVAFIGTEPIAIEEALADIMDELVMMSAQDGALYFPAEGISTLSELVPGQAYLLYVTEETTLTYPASVAPALSFQE